MINRIEITGINIELGADIKKYIQRKIGRLDRYISKKARQSVHAEVKIWQTNAKNNDKYECEIILHVPEQQLMAKESTLNMFAAVDIVESKMKTQLHKYKERHETQHIGHRSLLARLRRLAER